jgi:hypothetical protein
VYFMQNIGFGVGLIFGKDEQLVGKFMGETD